MVQDLSDRSASGRGAGTPRAAIITGVRDYDGRARRFEVERDADAWPLEPDIPRDE
jgi:hypothetical protein